MLRPPKPPCWAAAVKTPCMISYAARLRCHASSAGCRCESGSPRLHLGLCGGFGLGGRRRRRGPRGRLRPGADVRHAGDGGRGLQVCRGAVRCADLSSACRYESHSLCMASIRQRLPSPAWAPQCTGSGTVVPLCNGFLTAADLLCGRAWGVRPPGPQLLHKLVHPVEEDLPRAQRVSNGRCHVAAAAVT